MNENEEEDSGFKNGQSDNERSDTDEEKDENKFSDTSTEIPPSLRHDAPHHIETGAHRQLVGVPWHAVLIQQRQFHQLGIQGEGFI